MHPLNSQKYFGTNGIKTSYYNGTSVVAGYITKQVGPTKFHMTDGSHPQTVQLAPTTSIATSLTSGYGTIPIYPVGAGSGATITVDYGVYSASVVSSNGTSWNVSDSLALPSGAGALTVATVSGGKIATVTVGTAGSYTSLFTNPVTGTRAAGTGASFTAHYGVNAATIVGGGSGSSAGYVVSDVLTLTGTGSAQITVNTVDGGGGILTFTVSAPGTVTALPSNPVAPTGGTGTGATFTLTYKLLSVSSSGGTGYNVGDTLIFNGIGTIDGIGDPTASITTATSHAATTVTVSSAGFGITVAATSITTSTTTATFNLTYSVVAIAITGSGGSGYAVNDELFFPGIVAATLPLAHIATVSGGHMIGISTITVDSAGTSITTAATSVVVSGAEQYVAHIYDSTCVTTAGSRYEWTLGESENGTAVIETYSGDFPIF